MRLYTEEDRRRSAGGQRCGDCHPARVPQTRTVSKRQGMAATRLPRGLVPGSSSRLTWGRQRRGKQPDAWSRSYQMPAANRRRLARSNGPLRRRASRDGTTKGVWSPRSWEAPACQVFRERKRRSPRQMPQPALSERDNETFLTRLASSPLSTRTRLLRRRQNDQRAPAIGRWPLPDSDFHPAPEHSWLFYGEWGRFAWRRLAYDVLQHLREALLDVRPIILRGELGCGFFVAPAKIRVSQEEIDGLSERICIIGENEVTPVFYVEPLGTDRSGNDDFSHRHRFKNLQTSSTSDAKRHDHN